MVIQQTSPKSLNRLPLLLCLVLAVTAESSAQDRADAGNALAGEAFGTEAVASADAANATDQVDLVVAREGIVEMHIQDGKLYVVLQQLLLKSRRNIVFGRDVSGSVTVSLYNVTTEQALDAILKPNGFGYRTEGNFIYVYTQEDLDKILDEERILVTRTFRLNYISPTDAAKFIEPVLTPEAGSITLIPLSSGGLSAGGTGGDAQSLAIEDIIMVRDYEENFWAVEKILAEIDKRPKQVLVEATILRATLNEANALGIDQAELLERARRLIRRQVELQKAGFSRVEAYRAYAEEQGLDPKQLEAAAGSRLQHREQVDSRDVGLD